MNDLSPAMPAPTSIGPISPDRQDGLDRLQDEDSIGRDRERDNVLWTAGYKAGYEAAMKACKTP